MELKLPRPGFVCLLAVIASWSEATADEELSLSKPKNIDTSPLLHILQASGNVPVEDAGLSPLQRQKRTFGKWLGGGYGRGYGGGGCGYGCGGGTGGGYVAYPKVIEVTVVKDGGGGWGNTGGCGYGGCGGGGGPVNTHYPSSGGCGPGGCGGGGYPSYTQYPSGGGHCSTCGGGGGSYSYSQASASSSSGSWGYGKK